MNCMNVKDKDLSLMLVREFVQLYHEIKNKHKQFEIHNYIITILDNITFFENNY